MNQEKIGKFIAQCRKENGYTQAFLAEKLAITDRAVSKWENGKSMPDASIMIELCELLNINVNELLTGERIVMDDYKKTAESNMLELKKKQEKLNKALLAVEIVLLTISVIFIVIVSVLAQYAVIAEVIKVILIAVAISQLIICAGVCTAIEIKAGYYECPECGHRYVPDFKSYMFATHMGWRRKMRCPHCGKKRWQKKVYSK